MVGPGRRPLLSALPGRVPGGHRTAGLPRGTFLKTLSAGSSAQEMEVIRHRRMTSLSGGDDAPARHVGGQWTVALGLPAPSMRGRGAMMGQFGSGLVVPLLLRSVRVNGAGGRRFSTEMPLVVSKADQRVRV